MSRYLDPKADVVFKKVFATRPHLLISFLNAVLPLPENRYIVHIDYLLSESVPEIPIFKRTIADVKCIDDQGRIFIVEMQIDWTDSFKQRLLFQAGQALVRQLNKGEDYHLLQPVYGLGIVASNFDDTPQWYHHYQLVNLEKFPNEPIEHLQLIFIELKKFPIYSPQEKELRLLWLRFLREINEHTREAPAELQAVAEIKEALSLVEESSYSRGELEAYDSYWKQVSSEKTLMTARYAEGKAEGIAEGLVEGLAKGEVKGGAKTTLAIAKKMLAAGVDDTSILEFTGLSEEELDQLKK